MNKIVLLFSVAALAAVANAQLGELIPGPTAERYFRQAYSPVDRAFGLAEQYAPMGASHSRGATIASGAFFGGTSGAAIGAAATRSMRGAAIGAGVGAVVGGVTTALITRNREGVMYARNRQPNVAYTPSGRKIILPDQPKARKEKTLDCRKKKNRQACEAAFAEMRAEEQRAVQAEAEQARVRELSNSPYRVWNRTSFTARLMDGNEEVGQLRPNQSQKVLRPESGYHAVLIVPDPSGGISEYPAEVRVSSDFRGWIVVAPIAPEGREK